MSISITKRPLLPKITLQKNDNSLYTYDPFTSTFDFRLMSLQFKPVSDHQGGEFSMDIVSSNASNLSMNTLLGNVKEGNEVSISVGKTSGNIQSLFLGMIETITITEQSKNLMVVTMSGPDWGSSTMQGRIVNGFWEQRKAANGTDLDATDTSTAIENITYDLLTKTQYYAAADYAIDDQGVTVSLANMVTTGISVPQFAANMEKLSDVLKELNHIGGTECYIDHTKTFRMVRPESLDSGVLLTDDYTDSVATAWDQTKLGLILTGVSVTKSIENHLRRLIGLGGVQRVLDQKQESTGSSVTVHDKYYAVKFKPEFRDIDAISVYIAKVGSPASDLTLELVESDSSNQPNGSTIKAVTVARTDITTSANWTWFAINDVVNTSKDHWIILRPTSSAATDTYRWYHDGGSSGTNANSADGSTWTINTSSYKFAFREYSNVPLINIYNYSGLTASTKHFKEEVFRNPAIIDYATLYKWLMIEGDHALQRKVIVKCKVYAPDTLLKTNQKVRIRKINSGYSIDEYFTIGEITYIFQNSPEMATGTFYYDIIASEFETFI